MSIDFNKLWEECIYDISKEMNENTLKTWISPIKVIAFNNNVLELQVPNEFFYEWISEHYSLLLDSVVKKYFDKKTTIKYTIPENVKREKELKKNIGIEKISQNINFIKKNFIDTQNISGLNSKYTFENFIEGDCNQLARSSALSVALQPQDNSFNPLMIYGGVGLGKTHLLHAIGNRVKEKYPEKVVIYIQTTVFVNQFINSIRTNSVQEFSKFYSSVDILLLDDVQFLKDKDKTQEILFFIFNQLHQIGKQIVLTSDRPTSELVGLQDRLISRFKWGLTVNITIPDLETKMAILKSKITNDKDELSNVINKSIKINDNLIEYIAQRVNSNVRELEGIMITAIAKTSSEHSLDIKTIQGIINNISSNDVEVDRISYFVAEYFKISIDDILGQSRQKDIALARKLAMYFSKKYTKCSLKTIGNLIGRRDHSTVIHAINNIETLVKTEKEIKHTVENINKEILKNLRNVKQNKKR